MVFLVLSNFVFGFVNFFGSNMSMNNYLLLQRTENHRVCFGKSGIHGWGLFARRNIQGGEMVLDVYLY